MLHSLLVALLLFLAGQAHAMSGREIVDANTSATVYLETVDDKGAAVYERGTGFVVSQDGYVVTAAHVKPKAGGKLLAVVGQRIGPQYPLILREADESNDVALWQFPQASICRPAVTISTKPVKILDRVLALGFPQQDDLSPASLGITSVHTQEKGFYRADAYLWPGNSGGPVFNEDGKVVALVQGGTMPGTERNDLIPISFAINLLKKWNVRAGYDVPVPYENSCYQSCANPSKIVSWNSQVPWNSPGSGWVGGGHTQIDECNKMVAGALAGNPGGQIEIQRMWEDNKKDVFGHVEYQYYCSGILRSGPVYAVEQSSLCPLKQ
jgi:hypothetical protein